MPKSPVELLLKIVQSDAGPNLKLALRTRQTFGGPVLNTTYSANLASHRSSAGWLILLFVAPALAIGCAKDGDPQNVFQDMQGRTITWADDKLTLNNKDTHADTEKRLVILSRVGSMPTSAEVVVLTDAVLNKLSSTVHSCNGTIEREGQKLMVGVSGSSDRCAMFNGDWFTKGGSELGQETSLNSVPVASYGTYSGEESATVEISRNVIHGLFPTDSNANDQDVALTLDSVKKTGDGYEIEGTLNTLGTSGKRCSGSFNMTSSGINLTLSGNSRRCGLLSGAYSEGY
jgi:hypothetical protein